MTYLYRWMVCRKETERKQEFGYVRCSTHEHASQDDCIFKYIYMAVLFTETVRV